MFILHVEQPRLIEVLVDRARELDVEFRWGHGLKGFDQHDDGITVRIEGPDGTYDVAAQYLVGADGGTGAGTRYGPGRAHPWVGRWVPDFAVAGGDGTRRVAELARDGRPLLIDLTEGAVVAAVAAGSGGVTVATGRALGDVGAHAVLVRPDGYVAWASSSPTPDLHTFRGALSGWFGICAA